MKTKNFNWEQSFSGIKCYVMVKVAPEETTIIVSPYSSDIYPLLCEQFKKDIQDRIADLDDNYPVVE